MTERECTDETVLARLKLRAGMRYTTATLAKYFNEAHSEMGAQLKRLAATGQIQTAYIDRNHMYFWPEEKQEVVEQIHIFREYIPESGFTRVQEQIADYRAIASKGGD